jgi:hypothetical protein
MEQIKNRFVAGLWLGLLAIGCGSATDSKPSVRATGGTSHTGTAGIGSSSGGIGQGGTGTSDSSSALADGGTTASNGSGGTTLMSAGGASATSGAPGSGGKSTAGGTAGIGGSSVKTVNLTVDYLGQGTGVLQTDLAQVVCDKSCVKPYPLGTSINVIGLPTNGTDSYFGGFTGDCTGLTKCTLKFDQDRHITVDFRVQIYNFVFLSSTTLDNLVSGAAKYDIECNRLATNVGINNGTKDAYVAWVSDSKTLALDRLGTTARGFIRLDEKPVVDQVSDLLAGRIHNPIRIDEKGALESSGSVRTATLADGSAAKDNCWDFLSNSDGYFMTVGSSSGGPVSWTDSARVNCLNNPRVYCFGKTKSAPLVITKSTGKLIFLSNTFTLGTMTPDAACAASAPPGIGPVVAAATYTDTPGATFFEPTALYVRPDGVPIGTGAEIVATATPGSSGYAFGDLPTGIWQSGDGNFPIADSESYVWVGDSNITRAGSYCSDWTNADKTYSARIGDYHTASSGFWNREGSTIAVRACDHAYRFYCLER